MGAKTLSFCQSYQASMCILYYTVQRIYKESPNVYTIFIKKIVVCKNLKFQGKYNFLPKLDSQWNWAYAWHYLIVFDKWNVAVTLKGHEGMG